MERKEAIEVIKKNWPDSSFTMLREALETLIPELKESEDERIRKQLLKIVHDFTGDSLWVYYNIHKEDALDWLERRSQTFTKKDIDDAYLKGVCDTKHELEKQGEQKPAEWSNGDELMITKIIGDIEMLEDKVYSRGACGPEIDWLKSLKDRWAKELLDIARKQFEPELEQAYKNADEVQYRRGYEKGKADALKDMPKWKKMPDGIQVNAKGRDICLINYGDGYIRPSSCLGGGDALYLEISELDKLPKEE